MKTCRRICAAGIAGLLALAEPAVQASPITLNFQGSVTQANFDPFDPLMGAVTMGSRLYAYLNFDTSAPDAAPAAGLGSYTLSGGTYGFAPIVGSIVFPLMRTVNISIVNGAGAGPDQYSVFASEGSAGGLGDYFTMSILLQDNTGMAFSSDALPSTVPDVGQFAVRTFGLTGQYTDLNGDFIQYEVQGQVLPVPEPGTLGLVALALLAGTGRLRHPWTAVRGRSTPSHTGAGSANLVDPNSSMEIST